MVQAALRVYRGSPGAEVCLPRGEVTDGVLRAGNAVRRPTSLVRGPDEGQLPLTRLVRAVVVLLALTACTGPGQRPYGSTPALEARKLQELRDSTLARTVVGKLDGHVQQLYGPTDNSQSVMLTLTRPLSGTPPVVAFVAAVRTALQDGATFQQINCAAGLLDAEGHATIPSSSPAAAGGAWPAQLLIAVTSAPYSPQDSVQAALSIMGGPTITPPASRTPTKLAGPCPAAIRRLAAGAPPTG